MLKKKSFASLARRSWKFGLLTIAFVMVPLVAFAAEPVAAPVESKVLIAKYFAAALAMGLSALAAGFAQAKIGVAGAGTIAERPETATMIIVLQALPEIIVLLGFVSALIIAG